MKTSFYCNQCQTPEACQVICLFESIEGKIKSDGEMEVTGELADAPPDFEIPDTELTNLVTELMNF